MIIFEKKDSVGEIIATNANNINLLKDLNKKKEFFSPAGSLVIISDEEDMYNSSKIFTKVGNLTHNAFDSIYEHFRKQIIAQSHTLKKIQGKLIQKTEGVLHGTNYNLAENYEEQQEIILNKIKENPIEIADSLIYLYKRVFELSAHMASFEVLHMGEQIDPDLKLHNIRRLIINILHGFEDNLKELEITPYFSFKDDFAELNKIQADYKMINAAFYNLFDNAIKYVKPNSRIEFHLEEELDQLRFIISMISLRIDQDELDKVFTLGYRGRNCKDNNGNGVGMYVIKKSLKLNNIKIKIEPDYKKMEKYNNEQYILNKFILNIPIIKNYE